MLQNIIRPVHTASTDANKLESVCYPVCVCWHWWALVFVFWTCWLGICRFLKYLKKWRTVLGQLSALVCVCWCGVNWPIDTWNWGFWQHHIKQLKCSSNLSAMVSQTAIFWRKCKHVFRVNYSNTYVHESGTVMVLWRFQVVELSGWRRAEFEHSFFLNECCGADRVMAALLFSVSVSQSSIMLTHSLPPPALKPHDNQCNYHISTYPSLLFFPSLFVYQSICCFLLLSSLLSVYIPHFLWRCALFMEIQSCFTFVSKTVLSHSSTCCKNR